MIKNWIINWALKMVTREELFRTLFCPTDQIAIINALWRRSKDDWDKGTPSERQNEVIKSDCARLAKELSNYQ